MHVERRYLQSGVFLIAIGSVPLGIQLGWLDHAVLGGAGRLWPVVLIVIGLGIAVRRGPFQLLFRLLPPVVFGLLIGVAFAGGIGAIGCVGADKAGGPLPAATGTFDSVAEVDVTINCGTATLGVVPGSSWALSGTGDPGRPPSVDANPGSLRIGSPPTDFLDFGAARSDWHIQLPADPSLDVSLTMNAGDARLGLAGAKLGGLSITANAGTVRVDLSDVAIAGSLDATVNAGDVLVALPVMAMDGSITVNAGHVGLCVPPGVGVRIQSSGALSSNNFGSQGFSQDGSTWTSPDVAINAPLVDLQVTANAGNIELNPKGGCQ